MDVKAVPADPILVIDSDPQILKLMRELLGDEYNVKTASNTEEAETMLRQGTLAAVVCDHSVPTAGGTEMLRCALKEQPQAARLLLVSDAKNADVQQALGTARVHRIIQKPFRPLEFLVLLEEALHEAAATRAEAIAAVLPAEERLGQALFAAYQRAQELENRLARQSQRLSELESDLTRVDWLDKVTGLYNARFFARVLTAEVARAHRHQHPLSLLSFCVDSFAERSRALESNAVDALVRQVGMLLGECGSPGDGRSPGRISDIVARVDTDAFMVLLPETPKVGGAVRAERLCRKVAETEVKAGSTFLKRGAITLSCGVAALPDDAKSEAELMLSAAAALNAAKQTGGNSVR
jgi:diguanylate cyclase (GGDEF)-like protein